MNQIKEVLEKVYKDKELRKAIVPLFISDPGMGKSVMVQQFAKEKKVKLVEFITSQMSPFEISGIAVPDKEIKKMVYYNFDKLEQLKSGDILFFDELLNGNPVVLNACLTMLEQRRLISGKPMPNIMIVAAANPQGMSPITPQIKERFVWYNVKFDKNMWMDYMFNKYQMVKQVSMKLCNLIEGEDFSTNNFMTPRSIDKAVNMLIKGVSTPYYKELEPILNTLIKNNTGKDVNLGKTVLKPNEQIKWLDLVRLYKKVKITCFEEKEKKKDKDNIMENKDEILILDLDENIIGSIKNISSLKKLYYFDKENLKRLEEGNIIKPPPFRHSPSPPHSLCLIIFSKKNKLK